MCLAVIILSFMAFSWTLRLSFFGTLFAWSMLEMLLLDVQERPSREHGVPAFSASIKNIKRRTYGKLMPGEDASLVFAYRRLWVGPKKRVVVGRAESFAVGRGVFYPTVVEPIESADKHRVVFPAVAYLSRCGRRSASVFGLRQRLRSAVDYGASVLLEVCN
jgi:hypothetical protein